jgi:hypothetical protein
MVERKESGGFYLEEGAFPGVLSAEGTSSLGESFTNARRLLIDAHSACVVPDEGVEGVQSDLLTTLSSLDFPPIPPFFDPKMLNESGVFLPPLPESILQE